MAFYHNLVKWFIARRLERLDYLKEHWKDAQDNELANILQYGIGSRFAEDKGLFTADKKTFKKSVPLQHYADLESYIKRMRGGVQNELTTEAVKWFAKSSGTTSHRSKYIPLTKKALEDCHFAGGKDIMALYLNAYPESRLVEGKSLVLGGSQQPESLGTEVFIGDLSAVLIENLPFWAQWVRTPDRKTALLPNWERKLEQMVEKTSQEWVTSIAGVPSWNLVFLQRLLAHTGAEFVSDIWPDIELFIFGGVSIDGYRESFNKILGKSDFRFLETYNASEGFFGLQDDLARPDMLLMVGHGIYYECIEEGDWHKENPPCCGLAEVETGKNYELVITTNGGLWRYRIGDTIRFTSLNPPRFRFVGRTKYFINMSGEEVVIENVKGALQEACRETDAQAGEFTGGPCFPKENKPGFHEYVMAFSRKPQDLEAFTASFDASLRRLNSDYDAKRTKSFVLSMPRIHAVDSTLFYDWMKKRGKLGGQNKIPRLSNTREHLDELIELFNHSKK